MLFRGRHCSLNDFAATQPKPHMKPELKSKRVRVLYSFPHKIGASRICYTAWQQVKGLADAGADVTVFPGAVHRPLPSSVRVQPTLARGKMRLPYKMLGHMRAFALHDHIVARRLERLEGQIDIVHTWPLGALETLKTATRLGIPTVLERPNAHTRFAYEVVQKECDRIGVNLPPDQEHAYKADVLSKEEDEYRLADRLLCPSEFTMRTFLDYGFSAAQLARHIYGYDPSVYYPQNDLAPDANRGLTVLFVGVCAVRKGLHFALDAWLRSPAHRDGTFLIAGEFLPAYREKLAAQLSAIAATFLNSCERATSSFFPVLRKVSRSSVPKPWAAAAFPSYPKSAPIFASTCTMRSFIPSLTSTPLPSTSPTCTRIGSFSQN